MGDREPTAVGAVTAISDNHGSRAHDRALSDGVQRRDEQDHLREDQENTGNEQQVLPRVGAPSALGDLVLGDLRGQGRGIGRVCQHLTGQDRETGRVQLADLFPRNRRRSRHEPGSLGAPRDREAVNRKRPIADNRAFGTPDDGVDHNVALQGLSRSFLRDRQGQVHRVTDAHRQGPGHVLGNDGMACGQGPALTTRVHARRLQRSRLRAVIDREARAVGLFQAQLVERIDGDQLIALGQPVLEGVHRHRDLVARGRLRQAVRGEVLLDGRRRPVQRHRLDVAAVAEPRRGLVTLRGRDVPEGDRRDRNDDRQGDQEDRRGRTAQALARITRGDAEYYSPSPHPCAESVHQILGAVSASRSFSESPLDRSTMRPSRRKTVRSAHAAILAS